jgi:hypothetical protein
MPNRVTTYSQAFLGVLGIPIDDKIKAFLKKLEQQGHAEKGISFGIWRSQDKLNAFKNDHRFMSILENEINKWSWKKDDPRWTEYWNKKNEAKKAENIRKEIDNYNRDNEERILIDARAEIKPKRPKGYVYFIQGQCGGAIKVGYSTIPQDRLRTLQTGYPDTLKMLLLIPGNEKTEQTMHREFEASRLSGEWFRPDDYVIARIKELKAKYNQVEVTR